MTAAFATMNGPGAADTAPALAEPDWRSDVSERNICAYPEGCQRKRHGVYCHPPITCKVADCSRPATRHGYCKAHDRRFMKYGDPLAGGTTPGEPLRWIKAMVERAIRERPTDCILDWPFGRKRGYPILFFNGRTQSGHVLVLELSGRPKPPGQEGRHLCGRGSDGCLNPWHLEWGTHYQNIQDMVAHGTMPRGVTNGQAKLTESMVKEIRATPGTQRALAKAYGVDPSVINLIRNGKLWKHVS